MNKMEQYNYILNYSKITNNSKDAIDLTNNYFSKIKRELIVNQVELPKSYFLTRYTTIENFFENKDLFSSITSKDFLNKLIKLSFKDIKQLSISIATFFISIQKHLTSLKASNNVLFGLSLSEITGTSKRNKIKRLCNSQFLTKRITQLYISYKDTNLIFKNKLAGSYISDFGKKIIKERKEKQLKYLSTISILDKETGELLSNRETGEVMTLADLNSQDQKQKQKLNELYCIQKNLEQLAKNNEYTFLFITLTCPASFKPAPLQGKNTYDGSTVKEAIKLLNDCFSSFRKRKNDYISNYRNKTGLKDDIFGFWSKEPQADGTPHSHFLLYLNPNDVDFIKDLFKKCVKSVFKKNNVKFHEKHTLDIKGDNGVANPSTYIFKYIMKALSIKKFNVEDTIDKDGNVLKKGHSIEIEEDQSVGTSENYSLHKYRRYDTFGVDKALGAWREVKRLSLHQELVELALSQFDNKEDKKELNKLIELASKNNFLDFLNQYKSVNLKVSYKEADQANEYGEISKSPNGLFFNDQFIKTRKKYILVKLF